MNPRGPLELKITGIPEFADALRRASTERDAARAELSALRDRITALHYGAGDDLGNFCCACGWNYPCATVRLLEGDSDD